MPRTRGDGSKAVSTAPGSRAIRSTGSSWLQTAAVVPCFAVQLPINTKVQFSARWVSGKRVLTAAADGTARLWDGTTGRLLQTYKGGPRFLGDAVLMSDMVIGGDAEGLLRFWDAASGARLWTLPTHKSAVLGVHLEGTDIVTRGFAGDISRWRLPQSGAVIDACARSLLCAAPAAALPRTP